MSAAGGVHSGSAIRFAIPHRAIGRSGRAHLVVFAATLATRLPFVVAAHGIGNDPDAWGLRLAGQMFAGTGLYHPSRDPSYPAVELLSTALADVPARVLVFLTAVGGAVAVTAFADLLRTLDVRTWVPLTVAFAMTPVVFRSDLTFMDYAWADGATMLCLALLARHRPWGSGALLGLAVACRPAAATALVVVVAVLVIERRHVGYWARIAVAALAVALSFFLVPLLTIGPGVIQFVDKPLSWAVAAARLSTGVWGWAGAFAIAVALVVALARVPRLRRELPQDQRRWAVTCLVGGLVQVAIFVRIPIDSGYLVPLVPLVLLIIGVALSGRAVVAIAVALAVNTFISPTSSQAFGITVPQDLERRQASQAYSKAVVAALQRLPPNAVLVGAGDTSELVALYPGSPARTPEAGRDQESPPHRVTWPNGVVVTYSLEPDDPPPTGPVYRTPHGEPVTLPLLPVP